MKKQLMLISCCFVFSIQAQEVVSTQGDSYQNAAGSIDFTIGEPVINTVSNGTNDLTQGFHQTNWNFVGLEDHQPDYHASVFPNPVENYLHIRVTSFDGVNYALYDDQGRLIESNHLSGEITSIMVKSLAPGPYNLRLIDAENKVLKTFKLIKHH